MGDFAQLHRYHASDEADLRRREFARQQDGGDRDDIARRFEGAAAGGRAVGVERFDFVADPDGLAQIFGAADHAHAHLIGLVGVRGDLGAVQGIDADQLEPQLAGGNAGELQPLANDFERQPPARQGAGTGIGNLPLADETVDIADRDLERPGAFGCRVRR